MTTRRIRMIDGVEQFEECVALQMSPSKCHGEFGIFGTIEDSGIKWLPIPDKSGHWSVSVSLL